jgi:hypothetical protein
MLLLLRLEKNYCLDVLCMVVMSQDKARDKIYSLKSSIHWLLHSTNQREAFNKIVVQSLQNLAMCLAIVQSLQNLGTCLRIVIH